MTGIRSVPLAERRQDTAVLDKQIRAHRAECPRPETCDELADMRRELLEIRGEIAHWFDPGPDQEALF